ncbi:MAG TPA: M23 family metallopeptidase [Actinomycetota bacterium]|nr:M23 family metallopeptidase [Actinomycetota bacterium]
MAPAMRAGPTGLQTTRNEAAGGEKPRIPRFSLRFQTTAATLLAALAVACGQWEGAHQPTFDEAASRRLGELVVRDRRDIVTPPPKRFRKVIVERRVRKVIRGDGPFYICPVQADGYYSNDFGAPRYTGGYHPHQGNDIFAGFGSPIVAPFDGRAVVATNRIGGLAVKVFGEEGYVYNAHLVAFGRLGDVEAGRVIGYVGNTGNADGTAPHNHFEWHPRNGRAVNPYPFLQEVCR